MPSENIILPRSFFEQNTIEVAQNLLGKILLHESSEGLTAGRIVETEAYLGPEDQAAHSAGGRRTARNEVMYEQKGVAYVYFIYGLYHCVNITTGKVPGKPEAVLLRALEPIEGIDLMIKRRGGKQDKAEILCKGPSRLCIAMGISKAQNKLDITTPPLYIKDSTPVLDQNIVKTTRIGIDYAGDWKNRFWRFYIKGNNFVSVK